MIGINNFPSEKKIWTNFFRTVGTKRSILILDSVLNHFGRTCPALLLDLCRSAAVSVKIAFSIFEKLKYVNNQQAAIHCTVRMYS